MHNFLLLFIFVVGNDRIGAQAVGFAETFKDCEAVAASIIQANHGREPRDQKGNQSIVIPQCIDVRAMKDPTTSL